MTEDLEIYTAVFLSKERNEYSYTAEMKATKTYEPIVKLTISMSLKEYGLDSSSGTNEQELLPALLDDQIAVKELQELQEWKESEKDRWVSLESF